MRGVDLAPAVAADAVVRTSGLFGSHGAMLNVVTGDGWLAMLEPDWSVPVFAHTLGLAHMRCFPSVETLRALEWSRAFDFTQGVRLLRFPVRPNWGGQAFLDTATRLFDLRNDPLQERPLDNPGELARLRAIAREHLVAHDAPEEQYRRHGLA
jgi:hypothetical protein